MRQSSKTQPVSWVLASAMATILPATAFADNHAPSLSYDTLLSGLEDPWDVAFLQDGTMFFTEKCSGLSVMLPSGDVNKLMGMAGAADYAGNEEDLFCEGQAGLKGGLIAQRLALELSD